MNRGYMGKVLWVDLTSGTCRPQDVPDDVYQKVLSGIGLAAYFLYDAIPHNADPLGPDNVLSFVSGLLTGTGTLFTGRWMAAGKSPLTGTWGEANCGGTLSPAIKRCGYDAIFFTGASTRPVYLVLDDQRAELRDASSLWGLDAVETDLRLKQQFMGRPCSAACIGPAGEHLSLISGISNDGGRLAARSGLGAVMGSKRLKALVLLGSQKAKANRPEQVKALSRRANRWVKLRIPFPSGRLTVFLGTLMRWLPFQMAQDGLLYKTILQKWGTIGMNQVSIEMGDAPVRNWRSSNHAFGPAQSASINPDRITQLETRKYHCSACPLGCGGIVRPGSGSALTHKPEYETVLAWSGLLMNQDLDLIFDINEQLNRAGMDSISAGGTIAFAIECFENGLITPEDTGGLELRWGDQATISFLLDGMISREGIGDLLADGSRKAAQRLGNRAAQYAVHAGGQELAMHDPRNDPGFAIHASLEAAPGRHTIGAHLYYEMFQLWTRVPGLPKIPRFYLKGHKYRATKDKAVQAVANSRFMQIANGAGLCLFGAFLGVHRLPIFEWLNAVTGWNRTPAEYMQIGENIRTLRQAFNARQGAPLKHEINDRAVGLPPLAEGANKGRSVVVDALAPEYWRLSGWDERTGEPHSHALKGLQPKPKPKKALTAETLLAGGEGDD